jgi:hypothetical protein
MKGTRFCQQAHALLNFPNMLLFLIEFSLKPRKRRNMEARTPLLSAPAIIFALTNSLSTTEPLQAFAALAKFYTVFNPCVSNTREITPNSKRGIFLPFVLGATACVLATLEKPDQSKTDFFAAAEEVHRAASLLFGQEFIDQVSMDALMHAARSLPQNEMGAVLHLPASQVQLIMDFHEEISKREPNVMNDVPLRVCTAILEIMCLEDEGAYCPGILNAGGSLLAAGIIAAAFCAACKSPEATCTGQLTILSTLSELTAYPQDVIFVQGLNVLSRVLASPATL